MPRKRNPVGCATVPAAAMRHPGLVSVVLSAMIQEHEPGPGGWRAERETLPEAFLLTSGALSRTLKVIASLRVDTQLRGRAEAVRSPLPGHRRGTHRAADRGQGVESRRGRCERPRTGPGGLLRGRPSNRFQHYSQVCLPRVWRAPCFSAWMTFALHRFPGMGDCRSRLQVAELEMRRSLTRGRHELGRELRGLSPGRGGAKRRPGRACET
jgi:hypothetical protein